MTKRLFTALSLCVGVFAFTACGGNDCDTAADEFASCKASLDCTGKMGVDLATCEAVRDAPVTTSTDTVACEGAVLAAATACIGKYTNENNCICGG